MKTGAYKSLTLLTFALMLVQPSYAKIISCDAIKGDAKGWIPRSFVIDVSEDRKKASVVEPKSDVFGAVPFKKGVFGSDLWSRGKGRSKIGDFYNYQFQLVLKDDDRAARIELSMQGYRPLRLDYRCSSGKQTDSTRVYQPNKRVTNQQRARSASDENLCIFATREKDGKRIWDIDRGVDHFVEEAQKRGLTCGVTSRVVNNSENKEAQNSDLKSELLEAKDLFDSGLISEDEYEKLKKKLLGL